MCVIKLLMSNFLAAHVFGLKTYHFFNEPLVQTMVNPEDMKNMSLEERGITLRAPESFDTTKPLHEVSICLSVELYYGKPSCLFEVAGIQFTFSKPEDKFGKIRFTREQHDRTVIFNILEEDYEVRLD